MERCTRCILPGNYPGIAFDEDGTCSYCIAHTGQEYRGDEALRERVLGFLRTSGDRDERFDCVLALSGGRDSTYLLYYLVKVLDLKVLAYSIDNGFIPEQTKLNVKNMVEILGVSLVMEECDYLQRCIRHHLLAFMRRPSAPMVGLMCTGCRLGMDIMIPAFARESRVPVIVAGSNPIDSISFKSQIMALDPGSNRKASFILGYLSQVAQNPTWILNLTCASIQLQEYYHHFYRAKRRRGDLRVINPFYSYIRWEEEKLIATIQDELGWGPTPGAESTWRGDCDVALLKLYLYRKMLGYNDRDEGLSYLIRDGQIGREEALERLEEEGNISDTVVEAILDRLGVRFSALQAVLES
jgi:tRNA(Ile)-lysidine synthase TilS/MesJ